MVTSDARSVVRMVYLASVIANVYEIYVNLDPYCHFRSQTSREIYLMRPIPRIIPINQRRCIYRVQPQEVIHRPPRRRASENYVKLFLFGFFTVCVVLAIIFGPLSKKDNKAIPVHQAKLSVRDKSPEILKRGEVWGNRVNIREKPSLKSKVLGQVNEGTSLPVPGRSGDWYKVELKDSGTAYIFGAYLRPVNFDPGGIMLGAVKYEKAPIYIIDRGAVKKTTLPEKTKLLLVPAKGKYKKDFYLIHFPDKSRGYIRKKDVQIIH